MTKQSVKFVLEVMVCLLAHFLARDFPWNTVFFYFKSTVLLIHLLNFLKSLLIHFKISFLLKLLDISLWTRWRTNIPINSEFQTCFSNTDLVPILCNCLVKHEPDLHGYLSNPHSKLYMSELTSSPAQGILEKQVKILLPH